MSLISYTSQSQLFASCLPCSSHTASGCEQCLESTTAVQRRHLLVTEDITGSYAGTRLGKWTLKAHQHLSFSIWQDSQELLWESSQEVVNIILEYWWFRYSILTAIFTILHLHTSISTSLSKEDILGIRDVTELWNVAAVHCEPMSPVCVFVTQLTLEYLC